VRQIRFIVLSIVLLATALSACGRRGPLEDPPHGPAPAQDGFILDKLIK
jgi:predicted small lipoprotein YifL